MTLGIMEILVAAVGGFLLGEVLDVWYDGRVYYEGTGEARIFEPSRLYFGQIKYKIQFRLPESYEHYQWGIWLVILSFAALPYVPDYVQSTALIPIGTATSLILDENRTGIGGHPFGLGKDFVRLSIGYGCTLVVLLVGLYTGLIPRTHVIANSIVVGFPFLCMPVIAYLESKGILR